jgi:hypothetical protein
MTGTTPPSDDSGPGVLVVEDNTGVAATQLARGLSRGGYRVDHVRTGSEALAWVDPDVVLLDLEGCRTARWLLLAAALGCGLLGEHNPHNALGEVTRPRPCTFRPAGVLWARSPGQRCRSEPAATATTRTPLLSGAPLQPYRTAGIGFSLPG